MRAVWPFRHFGLKLLSVGLAILLWMVVSGEEAVERTLRVPLEMQQFPASLELQGDAPMTVDVRVRGASSTLARVAPGDIIAELDTRGARPGRRLFPVTPQQVRAPFGIEVLQVTPSSIAMVFEASATRQVPVAPAVEGKPAPGYVVGKVTAQPAVVEVVGPESSVKRVTEALTEPVSVAGARAPVSEIVTLGLTDPTLRFKTASSATITVSIQPAPLERTLRDLPVHLRNLASGLLAHAAPAVVTVAVRGSREALSNLAADDVTAYVDVAGLGSGQYTLTVRADASRDMGVTRIDPATVQVRIASAKN